MQIKTVIHPSFKELELRVCKDTLDDEVRTLTATLHDLLDQKISATDEYGNRVNLLPTEIVSFYAADQRVYALRKDKRYVVSQKLYELESELESACFTRISKSELINYQLIKCLDMSMTGTIKMTMKNGYETYTSRRNVAKIKELLLRRNEK